MDTGTQKTADSKSLEMTSVDRRPVETGNGKPLDRRKDERHIVKVEDEKYNFFFILNSLLIIFKTIVSPVFR